MKYDKFYFGGRTSFFYRLTGYREFHGYFNRLASWFRPYIEPARPILDVGCAYGYLLSRFGNGANTELHGCDVSSFAVERARALYPTIHFQISELGKDKLPYDDGRFGVVLATDVFEHVEIGNQALALAEIRRVLRECGYLCMTTPNWNLARKALYKQADKIEDHIGMRPMKGWHNVLAISGFELITCWTYLHGYLPVIGRTHTWFPECAIVVRKRGTKHL